MVLVMERARYGRWWFLYKVGSDRYLDLLYSGRSMMEFVWPDLILTEGEVFDMAEGTSVEDARDVVMVVGRLGRRWMLSIYHFQSRLPAERWTVLETMILSAARRVVHTDATVV
jgi:hypothetical protein